MSKTHLCPLLPQRAARGRALALHGTDPRCCHLAEPCREHPHVLRPPGATSPGHSGSTCTAAVPSLGAKGCSPFAEHLWKAPVKHFLGVLPPGLLQSAPAPRASRVQSPALSLSITVLLTAASWSGQPPSLELCLSHYYASAHFALFTFLLFKEITLKCTSAGSTFAFLELSIDISSNCLQLP